MPKPLTVGIVGAGASGTLVVLRLARLAEHTARQINVVVWDVPTSAGRGRAYGTHLREHYMNTVPSKISVVPEEPADFEDWIARHPEGRPSGLYETRARYGDYLREHLDRALSASTAIDVRLVESRARAVDAEDAGGYAVTDEAGDRTVCDVVVLATGSPLQPASALGPQVDESAVIGADWHERIAEHGQQWKRVLIVGASLSMADVVLSISEVNLRAAIDVFSRSGLALQSHAAMPGTSRAVTSAATTAKQLAREVTRAIAEDPASWKEIIDGYRGQAMAIWPRLSPSERAIFRGRYARYWFAGRNRIPSDIAQKLESNTRLTYWRGHLDSVAQRDGHIVATAHGPRSFGTRTYDAVFNCTGLASRITSSADPLLQHLFESGLAVPDASALGLDVAETFEVVGSNGKPAPGLFALGPLVRGAVVESTGVPEIRVQATAIAVSICDGPA